VVTDEKKAEADPRLGRRKDGKNATNGCKWTRVRNIASYNEIASTRSPAASIPTVRRKLRAIPREKRKNIAPYIVIPSSLKFGDS